MIQGFRKHLIGFLWDSQATAVLDIVVRYTFRCLSRRHSRKAVEKRAFIIDWDDVFAVAALVGFERNMLVRKTKERSCPFPSTPFSSRLRCSFRNRFQRSVAISAVSFAWLTEIRSSTPLTYLCSRHLYAPNYHNVSCAIASTLGIPDALQ